MSDDAYIQRREARRLALAADDSLEWDRYECDGRMWTPIDYENRAEYGQRRIKFIPPSS